MPMHLGFRLTPRSLTSILSIFFFLRWLLLDIENVLLKPVSRRQDDLQPLPPTPGPPSKPISKRNDR
jgi:hypothetical protein